MTDNEIIKALECCIYKHGRCTSCPLYAEVTTVCQEKKDNYILDLINRQKVEIERLSIELTAMRGAANSYRAEAERLEDEVNRLRDYCDDYGKFVDEPRIRDEAIKEFADRLCDGRVSNDPVVIAVKVELEMTKVQE